MNAGTSVGSPKCVFGDTVTGNHIVLHFGRIRSPDWGAWLDKSTRRRKRSFARPRYKATGQTSRSRLVRRSASAGVATQRLFHRPCVRRTFCPHCPPHITGQPGRSAFHYSSRQFVGHFPGHDSKREATRRREFQ